MKTFPNFYLGIGHLFPSEPKGKKSKRKKNHSAGFACLDVNELDDLVEGAQAKATKYATKYAVNVFQGNFLHLITTIKFSKTHSFLKKMYKKIKRGLYATDCGRFHSHGARWLFGSFHKSQLDSDFCNANFHWFVCIQMRVLIG